MFKILVDTCVWLDLAKDSKQEALIGVVEELVRRGDIVLLVPRVVLQEFGRNRERIERESAKSLATHFRIVRDAILRAGGHKRRVKAVLSHLDDADHKIPLIGGQAVARLDRVEKLLAASQVLGASDAVQLRAAQRAIDKRAPFHRNTNAMADAVLIEMYAELVHGKGRSRVRFAFVTHNKNDFSAEGASQKLPHPDIANIFSKVKSLYFINLAEALRRVDASLVTQTMLEQAWNQEPRGLTEILAAEAKLFDQVWYNRHWNRRIKIQQGQIKLVDKDSENPMARQRPMSQESCRLSRHD